MNAARSEIKRLPYKRPVAVTISLGASFWIGGIGVDSLGISDWSRAGTGEDRWKRAVDCSFGLGYSFE